MGPYMQQLFTDDYFPLGMELESDPNTTKHYVTWGEWKGKAWKHPNVVQKMQFWS